MMDALKKMAPHAHWLLRIGLASVFLYHGIGKFTSPGDMPAAMAIGVGLVEVGGGLFILLGALMKKEWMTQLAGLGFAAIMIGAIFMVHLEHGWNSIGNMGMEFQFTLLMTSLFFAFKGNGA